MIIRECVVCGAVFRGRNQDKTCSKVCAIPYRKARGLRYYMHHKDQIAEVRNRAENVSKRREWDRANRERASKMVKLDRALNRDRWLEYHRDQNIKRRKAAYVRAVIKGTLQLQRSLQNA